MKTTLLGPLEQQVMDILWKSDKPLKPLDVQRRLKGKYAYTTVMTVLKRLADKKCVCREASGKAYIYKPCSCKEDFVRNNLSHIYSGLVGSYRELAISQFVDSLKTNKDDLKLLQDYLKSQK